MKTVSTAALAGLLALLLAAGCSILTRLDDYSFADADADADADTDDDDDDDDEPLPCDPGDPTACDDRIACTDDVCNAEGVCENPENDERCGPGWSCMPGHQSADPRGCVQTSTLACFEGGPCPGGQVCSPLSVDADPATGCAPPCTSTEQCLEDGIDCTVTRCAHDGVCVPTPDDARCGHLPHPPCWRWVCRPETGGFEGCDLEVDPSRPACPGPCGSTGTCDEEGACRHAPVCDDRLACTEDICLSRTEPRCIHVPRNNLCPTRNDFCVPHHRDRDADGCITGGACTDARDCSDRATCSGLEICDSGTCLPRNPTASAQCQIEGECGRGYCDPFDPSGEGTTGCVTVADDFLCDDADPCTIGRCVESDSVFACDYEIAPWCGGP